MSATVPTHLWAFENIPAELHHLKQWVLWRYEKENGTRKKVPLNALTLKKADVTNPADWYDFNTVVDAFNRNAAAKLCIGIGMVFCNALSDYAGIDLDAPPNDAVLACQKKVEAAFASYDEYSPSGKGLHIIVRGRIKGVRNGEYACEAYSDARFFTFTGNVHRNAPIASGPDVQAMLELLWKELGGENKRTENNVIFNDQPQTADDEAIKERLFAAKDGDKARALWAGDGSVLKGDQSGSAIDLALVNIIQFYTKCVEQIERMWLNCPHGLNPKRAKKLARQDYRLRTIRKAFDREVAPVDTSALQAQWAAAAEQDTATPVSEQPGAVQPEADQLGSAPPVVALGGAASFDPYTLPPGLVGEIAQFFYDRAPRQVREIALAGALGWMAGVAANAYNVGGAGLNVYLVVLASSGGGKEAISSGFSALDAAVVGEINDKEGVPSLLRFRGPGDFTSPQALLKHLKEQPTSVSLITEFGEWVKHAIGPRAMPGRSAIKGVLLSAYGKCGKDQVYYETKYASKENSITAIPSPGLSLIGETTPSTFYAQITNETIEDGFLPRFVVIEATGPTPYLNQNRHLARISPEMLERCRAFVNRANHLMTVTVDKDRNLVLNRNGPHEIEWADGILEAYHQLSNRCTDEGNAVGVSEGIKNLWSRVHLNCAKLAALIAIGVDPIKPIITAEVWHWACGIVLHSNDKLIAKIKSGDVAGTDEEKQWNTFVRVLRDVPNIKDATLTSYGMTPFMRANYIVNKTWLHQRLGSSVAFTRDKMGLSYALKRVWERAHSVELLWPFKQDGAVSAVNRVMGSNTSQVNLALLNQAPR